MEDVNSLIEEVATSGSIQTYAAKVIAINRVEGSKHNNPEEAYTVNVIRSDGAEIKNVRLKASIQDKQQGVICIPKLDSWIFISIIETTETRAFISQYSEIDKIFLRIQSNEEKKESKEGEETQKDPFTFFEVQSDVNSTNLLFKKEVEKTGSDGEKEIVLENSTSLEFNGEQKSLDVKFWNENEEDNKIIHQTTIAHDKVETSFFDESEEDKVLQKTTLDKTKVAVDFEIEGSEVKGYQALIDKDKVFFKNSDKNIALEMTNKFRVEAGGLNLKNELVALIDEVKKIVVVQGVSPNIGALTSISQNLNEILEGTE